jgi:hypothetical protein
MSTERVDKQWKDKGLKAYSTAAILGTLNHYGVALDEAGFKEKAKDKYPLEFAAELKPTWKGTGQWVQFLYLGIDELSLRLFPERVTPMQTAHALIALMAEALKVIDGKSEGLGESLADFEKKKAGFPASGDRRDAFNTELVGFLEQWGQTFNELPRRLAKVGKNEAAMQFALAQEAVFTDREGCATALVRAMNGERDLVLGELAARVSDAQRDVYARYSALDALVELDAFDQVKSLGLALFDDVEKAKKWALADSLAHLLGHVVKKAPPDRAFRNEVLTRLERAHEHVGAH